MVKKRSRVTKTDDIMNPAAMLATEQDFKNALLLVSLSINVFVLCLWVAL